MARKAVVDKVEEVLAAGFTAAPIFGENEEREPPTDGSSYVIVQYPYCRSEQISVGAPGTNVWRDEGAFRVVLHVERGRPLATARRPSAATTRTSCRR
jgi:hypothetical protein